MEYNGRQRQHISAAREGTHSTLHGDHQVSHNGDKTFCLGVKPNGAVLIPAAVTGFGHPGERPFVGLAERQAAAFDAIAPRRSSVIWRNGVGFPRDFAREMVNAAIAEGLDIPADLSAALRE